MKALVAIIVGSANDKDTIAPAKKILDELRIPLTARVISAHRSPSHCADFAKNAEDYGLEVIIAAAGAAAALPGALAAHTNLPVIGVPINATPLAGLDALLSMAQMPGSTPVATMAIGQAGAKNAALLAARILSLKHPEIKKNFHTYQETVKAEAAKNCSVELF